MRHKHLGSFVRRNQPITCDWNSIDYRRLTAHALFPALKVNRAAKWRQHHKLRKGNAGTLCHFLRGLEGIWTVGRQSKNERPENMYPVFLKLPQPLHQTLAAQVKILEHSLQAFRGNGLNTNERTHDPRLAHRYEKLRIFGRFHRDLSEEDHPLRKLGQALHEFESLCTNGFQRRQLRMVVLPFKHFSTLAGGFALGLMMIPITLRSTEEFLRSVPNALREGAMALGASKWKTIATVIVPTAYRGILTAVLLAFARVAGETAPLLFTAFGNRFWSHRWNEPTASLPVMIFTYAISPYDDWHRQAWAAGLVLLGLILAINIVARAILSRGSAVPRS